MVHKMLALAAQMTGDKQFNSFQNGFSHT